MIFLDKPRSICFTRKVQHLEDSKVDLSEEKVLKENGFLVNFLPYFRFFFFMNFIIYGVIRESLRLERMKFLNVGYDHTVTFSLFHSTVKTTTVFWKTEKNNIIGSF